ncbi:dentin sialophosphoprotein [Coregonus clupeaformis]|uniref:dentin sialophosphoprotein n=1 Tax=Coregonus clupeaformis TaxID=59861 RepID=UPI001E1C7B81|nr:dentin sialophosphoprotein [Coregonus clupeaformis]
MGTRMTDSDGEWAYSISEVTDSGDDDLHSTKYSSIFCLNSGMGESGDSALYSSTDATESGDAGLFSKSIEVNENNSVSCSKSDNTDTGDDDLLPVKNMVGSGKYCRYCGRGESGDRHLYSSTDAVDSGEDDLMFVSSMADSGDMGLYSDKDSGDRGLSSVSDIIDSGESGLFSSKTDSEMSGVYSISESTDSGDDDLYPMVEKADLGKICLNSGMGESGDSALFSSTDATDSGDAGLSSKSIEAYKNNSVSDSISEHIDSGDADLFPVTSVVVSCCVYWGTGESGDRALNSSTDAVESGESGLSSISEIRGVYSDSDSVS